MRSASSLGVLGVLALLLSACTWERQEAPVAIVDLTAYRYATLVVIGHDALQDQAASELKSLGFQIVAQDDPHLQDPAITAKTLRFHVEIVHDVNGPALEMRVLDQGGAERFLVRRKSPDFGLALHRAITAFTPCHPAPSSGTGAPIEL